MQLHLEPSEPQVKFGFPESNIKAEHDGAEDEIMPPFFNSFDQAKIGVTNLGTGGPEAGNFNAINGRAKGLIVPCEYFRIRKCRRKQFMWITITDLAPYACSVIGKSIPSACDLCRSGTL